MTCLRYIAGLWMVFFVSCGTFDNTDLYEALAQTTKDAAACDAVGSLGFNVSVLPAAVAGRPWVGWLHLSGGSPGDVMWDVTSLPDGIMFDGKSAEFRGRPVKVGAYLVTVRASMTQGDCPALSAQTQVEIMVKAPCETNCLSDLKCHSISQFDGHVQVTKVKSSSEGIESSIVEPGETLAADGVTVTKANVPLSRKDNQALTHRIELRWDERSDVDGIYIDYAIPGGVRVPIEDEVLDLRFVRGYFNDSYLFLTRDGSLRFALYNGYLTPSELSYRCQPGFGQNCSFPTLALSESTCEMASECGIRKVLPVSVYEEDENAQITSVELMPEMAATVTNNRVFRLISSYEQMEPKDCETSDMQPYWHSFYMLPLGKGTCSYTEITLDGLEPLSASTKVVRLGARVVYPVSAVNVDTDWIIQRPDERIVHQSSDDFVFDVPGDYLITLIADVTDPLKQFKYPRCGSDVQDVNKLVSAQRVVHVVDSGK